MSTASARVKSDRQARRPRSTGSILLAFLGSMNLAITLLVVICFASVIGTVLQQNQPYQDYLIKFGPFWFGIFDRLALYDVYSAAWYLFILAFLMVSTAICLIRNGPQMLKEMTRFREHHQERSLRAFSNRREWRVGKSVDQVEAVAARTLSRNGFRARRKEHGSGILLAGMSGASNRLGYIFTHLAIVIIGIGGLIDGNPLLKYREWTGDLAVETRNIPVSQIDDQSRIPPGRSAFRGNVNIPEGSSAGVVFLPLRDGYVVQELPFRIAVEAFRIERYDNGEPMSFESDLVLMAPELDEPIRQTIAVNHPLVYNGYAIYQASFGDGGSRLSLRAWPLTGDSREPVDIEEQVSEQQELQVGGQTLTLELNEFETFNARPVPGATNRDMENLGPSFRYILRAPDGSAREFNNFMRPVSMNGQRYFLSGMRGSPAEEFQYLHLPADGNDSPALFVAFLDILSSQDRLRNASLRAAQDAMGDFGLTDEALVPQIASTARDLVQRLLSEGPQAVMAHRNQRLSAGGVEGDRQQTLVMFTRLVLERTLWEAYRDAIAATGGDAGRELVEADQVFFQDAMAVVPAISDYGAPVFLQLDDYQHRQAAGLMIARAPGQNIVYFGFALLIAGVFLLFYVAHRRTWCWIRRDGDETILLLAGANQRDPIGFSRQFTEMGNEMDKRLLTEAGPADSMEK